MNPFEKHGITHLSPSSLNTYAADQAYWALKYLLSSASDAGEKAWRGSAVEAGLDYWLFKRDKGAAQKAALDRFELEALGDLDPKVDKERLAVYPMLDRAIDLFADRERPTVRQFDIEYWFEGIEVPILGRIDYEWIDEGIEFKTVRRIPKEVPAYHGRQASLYQAARKKPWRLAYVSEKSGIFLGLSKEEYERHLKHLSWYAHNIRRGLATFSDKLELARLYTPTFETFYWSEQDIEAATKLWELN